MVGTRVAEKATSAALPAAMPPPDTDKCTMRRAGSASAFSPTKRTARPIHRRTSSAQSALSAWSKEAQRTAISRAISKSPSLSRQQAEKLLKMQQRGTEHHLERQLDIIHACSTEAQKLADDYRQLQATCQQQMTRLLHEQTSLCNEHRQLHAEILELKRVVNTTKTGLLDVMVGPEDPEPATGSGQRPAAFGDAGRQPKRQRLQTALHKLNAAFQNRSKELQKACVLLTSTQQLKQQTAAMKLKGKQLVHTRNAFQLQKEFLNAVLVADEGLRSRSTSSFSRLSTDVKDQETTSQKDTQTVPRKRPRASHLHQQPDE